MVDWLTRVFMVCLTEGRIPQDWLRGITLSIYKGKGNRGECQN